MLNDVWDKINTWFMEQTYRLNINEIISKVLSSVGGEALGTVIFLTLAALFVFLGGRNFMRWLKARTKSSFVSKARGKHYTILVAQLEGDEDGRQQLHILHSIANQFGKDILSIQSYPLTLALSDMTERTEALANAETTAQNWLKKKGADVLVWGEVARVDHVLRLRFSQTETKVTSKTQSYLLSETLELPLDFGEELGAVFRGLIATRIAPAYESGRYVADILEPSLNKLRYLTQKPLDALNTSTRISIYRSYAAITSKLGEQKGENELFTESIFAYQNALKELTREKTPLDWAITLSNLGLALSRLGTRETGTDRLKQAVTAFQNALKELTREKTPLDWAATQSNLGNALSSLGERETGTGYLEQAVTAFQNALKELTREKTPLDWAMTQSNLGAVLYTFGTRETGTDRLNQAVTAFQNALKELTREKTPLDWAATQSNLGSALSSLGERETGTGYLEQAVTAFQNALKELTREKTPLDWAMTQSNLGSALSSLGERETGTGYLEQAVTAFQNALKELTREKTPLGWAMTQMNLGNALSNLGERETGTGYLEQAVSAYEHALKERTRERLPLQWASTKMNLGIALLLIGERKSNMDCLEQADTAFRAALEEATLETHEPLFLMAQAGLKKVEAIIMVHPNNHS